MPPEGRPPRPAVSISLESIGFYGVSRPFLEAGSSMLTVHFLDAEHLLVTHSLRTLVPRRKEAGTENEDGRLVGAEIVSLPSGKVLASTVWHTHDHGRYLWSIGRGRFLVRIGRQLFVIAPLARLNTKEPFQILRFPERTGMPAAVLLSPDGELLTVETQVRERRPTRQVLGPTEEDREDERRAREVVVDFYRLSGEGSEASPLRVALVGAVKSPEPIALPLDGDGYLRIGENRRGQWPVVFHEFAGKAEPIAPVMSSCVPRLQLVSRSQFLAFACQGSEDRQKMESYGFDGHENWEESLATSLAPVSFAFAPEAGRFAMSRLVEGFAPAASATISASSASVQEIRVYQTESGDLLLKMQATPAFKIPENFDLSADGHLFAVVRGSQLEVYELPRQSSRDLKDLADARQFAPPPGSGPIRLGTLVKAEETAEEEKAGNDAEARSTGASAAEPASASDTKANGSQATDEQPASATVKTSAASQAETSATAPSAAGEDPAPTEHRRPPTLLNPGEKPENGKANKPQP